MLTEANDGSRQSSVNAMPGMNKMSQLILTALFALSLSFLTFAASFADVPRSEILTVQPQE